VTLTAGGAVTQTEAITASGLELLGGGSYTLTNTSNNISTLAANTSNDIKYTDANGFDIGTVGSTNGVNVGANNLTLEAISGTVTQSEAITAGGLELLGGGSYDLTNTSNNISTLAANTTNDIKYTDANGFDIGTVNTTNGITAPGKNVTLTAGGAVTQTEAITANTLTLIGTGTGSFDLSTQSNDVNKLTATTVNQDVKFKDINGFTVGDGTTGIAVGTKNVTLEAGGAVTQSEAITAGGL
jgi:hypothetical protein